MRLSRRRYCFGAICLVVALVVASSNPAGADGALDSTTTTTTSASVATSTTTTSIPADIIAKLGQLSSSVQTSSGDIDNDNAALAVNQQAIDDSNARLQDLETQLAAQDQQAQAIQATIDSLKSLATEQALNAYMGQSQESANGLVEQLRAASPIELEDKAEYAAVATAGTINAAKEQRRLAALLETERKDSVKTQKEVVAAQEDVVAKRAALVAQQQNDVAAQAQAEAQLVALLASIGQAPTTPIPAGGLFSVPVTPIVMTSPYGMRVDPITGNLQLHAGQDFAASVGQPVMAAGDGTVVLAGPVSGYGNYTCIAHGAGLSTCYGHQSKIGVVVGQHVVRGQIIGLAGSTGNSTGPHVHFEVRVNGAPVDPLPYLGLTALAPVTTTIPTHP